MTSKHQEPATHVLIGRNSCVAVVLTREDTSETVPADGPKVFADFQSQNSACYWNSSLARGVRSLEYFGCLAPSTLLLGGSGFALEAVRSAFARRLLRPPRGFVVSELGDVGALTMRSVAPTQWAPLPEAICKAVAELNATSTAATAEAVASRLAREFPGVQTPGPDVLHDALGRLIRDRKLYHTGEGYFVVSADTYRQRTVTPLCERQMLLTNEEALVKLHGGQCSLATQVDEVDIAVTWNSPTSRLLAATKRTTIDAACQSSLAPSPDFKFMGRSHSLRILKTKNRPKADDHQAPRGGSFKMSSGKKSSQLITDYADLSEIHKCEKQSVLTKLLKRMQSLTDKQKHVTFSAQFPPPEWLQSQSFHCHSVATQTQVYVQKAHSLQSGKQTAPACDNYLNHDYAGPSFFFPRPTNDSDISSGQKNVTVQLRQGKSKYSLPNRYSQGAVTNYNKRKQRHRRSSSESPKLQKTKKNELQNQSSSSKSPVEENRLQSSASSSRMPTDSKSLVNPNKPPSSANLPKSIPVIYNEFRDTPSVYHLKKDGFATSYQIQNNPVLSNQLKNSSNFCNQLKQNQNVSRLQIPSVGIQLRSNPLPSIEAGKQSNDSSILSNDSVVSNRLKYKPIMHYPLTYIPPTNNKVRNNQNILNRLETNPEANLNLDKNSEKLSIPDDANDLIGNMCSLKLDKNLKNSDVKEGNSLANKQSNQTEDSQSVKDAKLALSESSSVGSLSSNDEPKEIDPIKPLKLKKLKEMPKLPSPLKTSPTKEIIIDNSVSVEVAVEKLSPKSKNKENVSTTVVTEETTVTKGTGGNSKVVTVTSITTSLSQGTLKEPSDKVKTGKDFLQEDDTKDTVNDLNIESEKGSKLIDCSSSCNIVTEVK